MIHRVTTPEEPLGFPLRPTDDGAAEGGIIGGPVPQFRGTWLKEGGDDAAVVG